MHKYWVCPVNTVRKSSDFIPRVLGSPPQKDWACARRQNPLLVILRKVLNMYALLRKAFAYVRQVMYIRWRSFVQVMQGRWRMSPVHPLLIRKNACFLSFMVSDSVSDGMLLFFQSMLWAYSAPCLYCNHIFFPDKTCRYKWLQMH